MTISNKSEIVNTPSIQIDKNVITYGNSFICTDSISLITISPVPPNMSWIGAIILAIVGVLITPINFFGILILIAATIWFIVVTNQNYNRGKNLAINLNSGTTLYFNCKDVIFLEQVVSTMIDSIKNKNNSIYSINFEKCTINGGVLNKSTLVSK